MVKACRRTVRNYSHLLNDSVTRAAGLMAQGLAPAREEVEPKEASRPASKRGASPPNRLRAQAQGS